jgi:hypothetical protein
MLNEIALIPFTTTEGEKMLIGINQIQVIKETTGGNFVIELPDMQDHVGTKEDNLMISKLMEMFYSQRFLDMMNEINVSEN